MEACIEMHELGLAGGAPLGPPTPRGPAFPSTLGPGLTSRPVIRHISFTHPVQFRLSSISVIKRFFFLLFFFFSICRPASLVSDIFALHA
jgi:hypothetical protein